MVVKLFDLQVGELEEPLVIERTVSSSNPFLVMISFFPDFHDISLRMRTTKMILEWAMRCWTLFRLMRGGTFSNGEATQKLLSLGYLDTETLTGGDG